MSLAELIQACREAAGLGEEFALFGDCGEWVAYIVNPSPWVSLGEVQGRYASDGFSTPEEAVADLLAVLKRELNGKSAAQVAEEALAEYREAIMRGE